MKPIYLPFLIIFFLFTGQLFSQDESFLGLSFGGAFPLGTFAETDFYKEGAGYAETGFMFAFDAAWFPDDYLGIGATVTYASNNPNKEQYLQDLRNDFMMNYPELGDFLDSNFVFDYGVWRYLNIFIGPNFTVNAGRVNFDLRAMAGLTLAWQPDQTIDATYQSGSTFSRKENPGPVPTIGYSLGGGIRYAFRSGFVLRVMADYANSKPTFELTETVLDLEGQEVSQQTREVAVPIKNVHVGVGIAYNFDL